MKLKDIKKCRKEITLITIGIIQIFLLIVLTPSNSYFISQSNDSIKEVNVINNKKEKNLLSNLVNSGINLLVGFLSIKQIGTVSAQENDFWCCEILALNGATCQPISESDDHLCNSDGQVWMTDCESTSLCKTGTCVDEEYGTCSPGTKKECGNNWDSKSINEIPKCQLGCCTLNEGTRKKWWTNLKCNNEEGSFDSSVLQSECKVYTSEGGACVLDDGDCIFTTEGDCKTNHNGNHHKGVLCTNPNLNTICSRPLNTNEIKTTCHNQRVHFVDSCGNIANVYDTIKWNNENYWLVVQAPTCTTSSNPSSAGSATCGDCDTISSICASSSETVINPEYGDYVCKDLRCDFDGDGIKEKQSSESICVYESYIGYSKDVVGSAHIRKICSKGEIKYDICDVYRGEICATLTADDGSSIARCRINEGLKCLVANEDIEPYEYTDDKEPELINEEETFNKNKETCLETSPDCRLQSIDVDTDVNSRKGDYFKFDACVPKYPPGFDLTEPPNAKNYKARCNIATQTCTTVWRKGFFGNWNCLANCECLTQEFAEQMNDLCISLGDCGGYVNIEGKWGDDGFETFDIDKLDEKDYNLKEGYDADGDISKDKKNEYKGYATDAQIGKGDLPSYFSGAEIGQFGGTDALEFEISDIKDLTAIAHIISGIAAAVLVVLKFIGVFASWNPVGWLALIIAAVLEFFRWLFGWGEINPVDVKFECEPWEQPSGGDDCDVCNEVPETCTEYKCESLGAGCELIDKNEIYGSQVNICTYAYSNDHTEAQIVNYSVSSGYKFVNLQPIPGDIRGGIKIESSEEGGCIQEFSQINFSLKTINPENNENEYARCAWNWHRVDPDPIDDYKNVPQGEDFKESPYYSIEHTFEGRLPIFSSDDITNKQGNIPGERTGQLNMYVRCKDKGENFNFDPYIVNFCIKEGPDNTAATITQFIPKNGGYLAYGETTKPLIISLNEPADCNWTLGTDKQIEDMENNFTCTYNEARPELGGTCMTTLTGLTESINNIYIKCKDQPWISEDGYTGPYSEEDRNVNTEDFLYVLRATKNPLNITSISPQGTVERGGKLLEVNLEATTSGGVNKGIAICKYRFIESPSGISSGDFFFETFSTRHRQPLSPPVGNYNIAIECNDEAGNKATGNAIFNLILDSAAPRIVRAYKSGSSLKLITDEEARCYYNLVSCNFNFEDENVVSVTTAYSEEHTADWNPGRKYYIKCEDTWENRNSGCAIIISPA